MKYPGLESATLEFKAKIPKNDQIIFGIRNQGRGCIEKYSWI